MAFDPKKPYNDPKKSFSDSNKQNTESTVNYKKEFEQIASENIGNKINADGIAFAEKFAKYLMCKDNTQSKPGDELTTSQIRNFFGEVRRIQMKGYTENKSSFYLLKPKLAYAAARAGKERVTMFREVMDVAHEQVKDSKQYDNFCDFLEAILAYHKANGGK